ncbi:MAG TPA: GAF domain-containing sensor histidine kinase [Burkholderiales bacterium]|nr:GAF domain-containing sensor histidine kinase [Burkholderiales bacterium]
MSNSAPQHGLDHAEASPAGNDLAESELARQRQRLNLAKERAWRLEQEKKALELEVEQRRLAEELAHRQSEMLIQSLDFLASESSLDEFLGHVLQVTVDQFGGVGGTLWFPDREAGTARLHLEYLESRVIPASESRHPAVRHPPPVGGGPMSTFPGDRAETYVLSYEVSGMPEENRAYIMSLGVRALLTVPMVLGKETVGWICIRSTRMDTREMQSKIRVAEALASQATLAVQMARLAEQARQAAILEERNRIARDIHDTLAQGFTGVVVNLEASSRALKKQSIDIALEHIEHAQQLAQAGLEEARLSVRALRPEGPADLSVGLDALAKRIEETGSVRARLIVTGAKRPLAREAEVELLRIAQESVTNVLKHAQAREVALTLEFANDGVRLTISDDGAGFDRKARHEGFGLIGMRERAERLGARLSIETSSGGTIVEVAVPNEGRR